MCQKSPEAAGVVLDLLANPPPDDPNMTEKERKKYYEAIENVADTLQREVK